MSSDATSNAVLLRKDDVPGSSTAVSFQEVRTIEELQAVAYKLFARDQRPHDVEFLRITPDGAEPIDSNLWNGGFYFRQVDGTTSLVLIDVNLTPLIHPEVNRDSNSDAQSAKTNSSHNSWQADGSLSKMGDSSKDDGKPGGAKTRKAKTRNANNLKPLGVKSTAGLRYSPNLEAISAASSDYW
uniref:Uncharacterized protein n=1 Tax=Viridothelium virens TaxID=1048519 RepID=A0A6A6H497_VIRVR|nr:hypothetical protein EV356DRAFT_517299 [Viridothelium virens]